MRIPDATYRLQVNPDFDLAATAEIVPYLARLGISDIYLSPIFQAAPGSGHGYDVVDPTRINTELGGEPALQQLHDLVKTHDMGWLQDIVPNHMAFDSHNVMLMDILENGSHSPYFNYFDIDWDHVYEGLKGRLLAPFLGKFYGEALEAGEIQLGYDRAGLHVRYYELRLPLRIETYVDVLTENLSALETMLGEHHPDVIRFVGTVHTLDNPAGARDRKERAGQIRFAKTLLWDLYSHNGAIREYIDSSLARFNGEPGQTDSFNLLDALLGKQHFRLAFWKVATEEINYRRFFTINNLISVRLEDDAVFDQTHRLIADLCRREIFTGLRIDHIDGLHDPEAYLDRLADTMPDRYTVVEKILEPNEILPDTWPIAGTTGYDFLDLLNRLFIPAANAAAFDRLYSFFTHRKQTWDDLTVSKKRLMIDKHLAGNIDNLAHQMKRISAHDRHGNDLTLYGLRRALVEVMAHFPVYRTYISEGVFSDADRAIIAEAVSRAREQNQGLTYELAFIERFLQLDFSDMATEIDREKALDFVMRFQQVTGPLMAKGIEDTCLYIYNRLLSHNEVGSDPSRFGGQREDFHTFLGDRASHTPHAMNTTATHDTKRGEDARARLNVLSEIPGEWSDKIREWRKINTKRRTVRGQKVPDRNDEYFLYQAMLASWPFHDEDYDQFVRRLKDYSIKAVREAKVHTAWLKPDAPYEDGFLAFIDSVLDRKANPRFQESFVPFWRKIAWYGMLNSIGQVLAKVTAPGVPDIYQGTEFWDLSMVDPDNRRPVDYTARQAALTELERRSAGDRGELLTALKDDMYSGWIKLFVSWQCLQYRRNHADLFTRGEYVALETTGARDRHVAAYARRLEETWVVTVIPRMLTSLIAPNTFPIGRDVWQDTSIVLPDAAPRRWRNVFTGETFAGSGSIALSEALNDFPLALLTSEKD